MSYNYGPTMLADSGGYSNTTTQDPMKNWLQEQIDLLMRGGGGGGSASNYMTKAQGMLGPLDLSSFEELRGVMNDQYNTSSNSLQNQYNTMLQQLEKAGTQNKQAFGKGRASIMENSFERGRDALRALSSRGMAASGLQQLGDVQQRMETGRQTSGLAGQFYDVQDKLADSQVQGQQNYETQKQTLENSLNQQMAQLSAQELQFKNSYQQQVASLAMQMQQQAAQASAAKLNRDLQLLSLRQQMEQTGGDPLTAPANQGGMMAIAMEPGANDLVKIAQLQSQFNLTPEQAKSYLGKVEGQLQQQVYQQEYSTLMSAARSGKYTPSQMKEMIKTLKDSGITLKPSDESILISMVTPASKNTIGGVTDAYGYRELLGDQWK